MEEIDNQMEPRRRKKLMMHQKRKCFINPPTSQAVFFKLMKFLQKFKFLCQYCFRCKATLSSLGSRMRGSHLLIHFLAELQGRVSRGCWFKFQFNILQNSEAFANQAGLDSPKYSNFTSSSYSLANVKLLIKFKWYELYLI